MNTIFASIGIDRAHLHPFNNWAEDREAPTYEGTQTPVYLIDETTGELYFNESNKTIRLKFLAAATVGMVPQAVGLVAGTGYRILRILSFHAFWRNDELPRTLSSRFSEWFTDIFRVIISPLGIPCLFLTGLYGLIRPRDGRKLHSRMEFIFHGHPLIVPCMHPLPYPQNFNNGVRKFHELVFNVLAQPLLSLGALALRIICFLSGHAFWKHTMYGRGINDSTHGDKIKEWLKDGLGILTAPLGAPLALAGLAISVFSPEKGELVLNIVKTHIYGNLVWFDMGLHPHLFGGNSNQQDAW